MIEPVPTDATLACPRCDVIIYRPAAGGTAPSTLDIRGCEHCLIVLQRDEVRLDGLEIVEDPVLVRRFLRYRPPGHLIDLMGEDSPRAGEALRALRAAVEDRENLVYRIDFDTFRFDLVVEGVELEVCGGDRDSWARALRPRPTPASRWVHMGQGHAVLAPSDLDHLTLLRDDGEIIRLDRSHWPVGFYHHELMSPGRQWAGMLVGSEAGAIGPLLEAAARAQVLIDRHQPIQPREGWRVPPEHTELLILLEGVADAELLCHYEGVGELLGIPSLHVDASDFEATLRAGMTRLGVHYELIDPYRDEVPVVAVSGVWESSLEGCWTWCQRS